MIRIPVVSSNLKSVGYDPKTKSLEVEFKGGGVHQYLDVSTGHHKALMSAPSIGSYFHEHIRSAHKSKPAT